MAKIFLICPVRKAGDAVNERIAAYVASHEARGDKVHWPKRDTKQDGDPIGNRICRDNREAMFAADEVHVWYDPESRGSCFDIGMAVVYRVSKLRPVRIANPEGVLNATPSPQLSLLISMHHPEHGPEFLKVAEEIRAGSNLNLLSRHAQREGAMETLCTAPTDTGALCVYGIIFASMRTSPRKIVLGVELAPTPEKSFDNFLRWLADETKDGPKII